MNCIPRLSFLIITAFAVSCVTTNNYSKFFYKYYDISELNNPELLKEGDEPLIVTTKDLIGDSRLYEANGYFMLGTSSFNGSYVDTKWAKAHAVNIGATLILLNSQFTDNQTHSSNLILPDNRTSYRSGHEDGTSYFETNKTYGIKSFPYRQPLRLYDQKANYFVKDNRKFRYGIIFENLGSELRMKYQRNSGIVIKLVYDQSPAFYANLLVGDVIIGVDGVDIKDEYHAQSLMNLTKVNADKTHSDLTILRAGKTINLTVRF